MSENRRNDDLATTADSPPPSWGKADGARRRALFVAHSADAAARGRTRLAGDTPLVVGRDAGTDGLSVRDGQLSRVHFRIGLDSRAEGYRIADAQSRNGTILDGLRIETALLTPNAVIRAGESVFVFGDPTPLADVETRIDQVASTDLPVLITGETGTGKERLARSVHAASGRRGPFVALNCGAVVRDLLAAELFGHTRGAFSGAHVARPGLFRSADGGTLFLDEIGDLPLELQPVLLRTLEEGTVRPVGDDTEVRVDVRVVSATHVRLDEAVKAERFRADLHARLSGATVHLPALRERRTTVLALAREFALAAGAPDLLMTANAAETLVRYHWPYNVRQLVQIVRAFVATRGEVLDLPYLEKHHPGICAGFRRTGQDGEDGSRPPEASPRSTLQDLLTQHGGNVSNVAAALGKPRSHVYRWLKTFGLDPRRFRQ
jgi:DNA-binding NtrC family response regulator